MVTYDLPTPRHWGATILRHNVTELAWTCTMPRRTSRGSICASSVGDGPRGIPAGAVIADDRGTRGIGPRSQRPLRAGDIGGW